jgi:hypothetical protein
MLILSALKIFRKYCSIAKVFFLFENESAVFHGYNSPAIANSPCCAALHCGLTALSGLFNQGRFYKGLKLGPAQIIMLFSILLGLFLNLL